MKEAYEKILNYPHPISERHPQMTLLERAAQFAPFSALSGYKDELQETARQTEERSELDETEKEYLNRQLQFALRKQAPVSITYFVPDERKEGGRYITVRGEIRRADPVERILYLSGGEKISIEEIREADLSMIDFETE